MKKNFFLFLLLIFSVSYAQKQNNNWTIGSTLLNFNNNSINDFSTSQISRVINQGMATVSDRNTGDLIFFTNGVDIFDKNGNLMDNGSDLFGTSNSNYAEFMYNLYFFHGNFSDQPTIIIPMPGDDNKYYVFSLSGNKVSDSDDSYHRTFKYGLAYAIVDASQNNGLGKVISKHNVLMANTETNVMTSCLSNDGNYWLATQDNAGHFLSYKITSNGISSPVVSTTAYNMASLGLKISPDKTLLFDIGSRNLYNFNNINGQISFKNNIVTPNTNSSGIYLSPGGGPCSAEFSSDSNVIYFISSYATIGLKNAHPAYFLCKYNVGQNQLYGYDNFLGITSSYSSKNLASLQKHDNGNIYMSTYDKSNVTETTYSYSDSNASFYKITNTNSTANNFSNLVDMGLYSGRGYTLPQLVEYSMCISNITVNNPVTSSQTYIASGQIVANSVISPNLNVYYKASKINLKPGFKVSGINTGIFVAQVAPCTGRISSKSNIGGSNINEKNKQVELRLYPNPTFDYLNIDSEETFSYEIYNVYGSLIQYGKFVNNQISVAGLPKAVYLIKLINETKKQIVMRKIIVDKK